MGGGDSGKYSCRSASETLEWIHAIRQFLAPYSFLINAHVVNFFTDRLWEAVDKDWIDCLRNEPVHNLLQIPSGVIQVKNGLNFCFKHDRIVYVLYGRLEISQIGCWYLLTFELISGSLASFASAVCQYFKLSCSSSTSGWSAIGNFRIRLFNSISFYICFMTCCVLCSVAGSSCFSCSQSNSCFCVFNGLVNTLLYSLLL